MGVILINSIAVICISLLIPNGVLSAGSPGMPKLFPSLEKRSPPGHPNTLPTAPQNVPQGQLSLQNGEGNQQHTREQTGLLLPAEPGSGAGKRKASDTPAGQPVTQRLRKEHSQTITHTPAAPAAESGFKLTPEMMKEWTDRASVIDVKFGWQINIPFGPVCAGDSEATQACSECVCYASSVHLFECERNRKFEENLRFHPEFETAEDYARVFCGIRSGAAKGRCGCRKVLDLRKSLGWKPTRDDIKRLAFKEEPQNEQRPEQPSHEAAPKLRRLICTSRDSSVLGRCSQCSCRGARQTILTSCATGENGPFFKDLHKSKGRRFPRPSEFARQWCSSRGGCGCHLVKNKQEEMESAQNQHQEGSEREEKEAHAKTATHAEILGQKAGTML